MNKKYRDADMYLIINMLYIYIYIIVLSITCNIRIDEK